MSSLVRRFTVSTNSSIARRTSSLTLEASLNNYASCSAAVHIGDTSGAAEPPLAKVASLMGASQRSAYSESKASLQASLSADGGSVEFTGFETMPFSNVSVGAFQPAIAGVHATSVLDRLQMDLYSDAPGAAIDTIQTPNLPERILGIVKAVVKDWIKSTYPALSDDDKKLASQIHETNTPALKILESILNASPEFEVPELSLLLDQAEAWHDAINQWILRGMLAPYGGFFGALNGLAGGFGMVYCPSFGGESANGFLQNVGAALDAPVSRTSISGLRIQGAGQQPGVVPVTRVVIERVPFNGQLASHRPDSGSLIPGQVATTSIVYPPQVKTGRALVVEPPAFMAAMVSNARGAAGASIVAGNARQRVAQITERTETMNRAIRAYLTSVARNVFRMECLRSSTASVTLPLSLDWQPGKAYEIGVNGPLFTGLLSHVQHAVSSDNASASTTLQFSHVQWSGFSASSLAS